MKILKYRYYFCLDYYYVLVLLYGFVQWHYINVKCCLLRSVWWEVLGVCSVFGVFVRAVWALTESAQAGWKSSVTVHRLSILSLGMRGPGRIETHVNTLCVCLCVCVSTPYQCERGKCRWVHIRSLSLSPSISLFSSPLKWWKLVLYKDPLSAARQQLHREHLSSSISFLYPSLPLFFCLSLTRSPLFLTHRIRGVLAGEDVTLRKSSIVQKKSLYCEQRPADFWM